MSLEGTQYGHFLRSQREYRNVEKEALGEGIYSLSTMDKVERGNRYPDKLARDRLLARLGESGYDYECYLQMDEYADWEERRDILDSLDDLELDKAAKLLAEFEKKHKMEDKVTKQFLLAMEMQYMELSGAPWEERRRVMEETVKLTVPGVDEKSVSELLLSVQELNLVLEYIAYRQPEDLEEQYRQLQEYILQERFDMESRAMFGSKLALYYCRHLIKENAEEGLSEQQRKMEQALEISTWGIEELRNHGKIYFAWELLGCKKQYLEWLLEHKELLPKKEAEEYGEDLEQTREFWRVLEELYETYQVPKATNAYTCFYREHEIYCINDVIRARRRMLGITAEELEEKLICSASTLKRIEGNKSKVQMTIVQGLFQYMHMSMETHRNQIVTSSQEALFLEKEYRWVFGQREYEKAEELLEKIKEQIPMEELINRQYIASSEVLLCYRRGEITTEEYGKRLIDVLEYTMPLEVAMAEIKEKRHANGRVWPGEKYLTVEEATILKNLAGIYGENGENPYLEVLREYYEWLEKKCTMAPILGMYGFVMPAVASWWGNLGKYEESSALNRKIMKESLRVRTLGCAHRNLYGILWNDRKQKGLPMVKEDPVWRKGLLNCLVVAVYCRDDKRVDFIQGKLKK